MTKDVCVVHIEDEYYQMQNLASRMKQYAEQYWSAPERGGFEGHVRLVKADAGEELENTWVVYNIDGAPDSEARLSYIFVAGPELPTGVLKHILPGSYFIIDVLRSQPKHPGLGSTATLSIASVQERVGASIEDITIYTACQGSDRNKLLNDYPGIRMISKDEPGKLAMLIGQIVVSGLNGQRLNGH